MLVKKLIFSFITLLCVCKSIYADDVNSKKITYHPAFKGIPVPANVNANGKVVIDAPIGTSPAAPILKTYINGHGPFFFMFDSGWAGAMISKQVAKQLKLPLAGVVNTIKHTPSQVVEVFEHLYHIDEIKIGGVTLTDYAVNASSGFEDEVNMFSRRGVVNEVGIDGVLGLNSFFGLMVTIDYKNEKLTFESGSLKEEDKDTIHYGKALQIPNINLTIYFERLKKQVEQIFLVDTGFDAYIKVNSCKIPEMHRFTGREGILSYDYTGHETNQYFAQLYGNIEILPHYRIKSPYIIFASTNCNIEPKGLLGRTFFEKNLVIIDHDDQLVKIKKFK